MNTIIVVGIVLLAFLGAPVFACLAAFAIWGAPLIQPGVPVDQAFAGELVRVFHMATGSDGSTLATIPLFTFMGYVLAESKTADRLVNAAKAWVGWFPGGLAIVTIFVCALFTTVTGASGVTIVAVGGLMMPALLKEGYSERFSLGLITSTGSIGLLFPPALPLIIYGIVYGLAAQATTSSSGDTMQLVDFSLQRFMMAGIVPGLVLTGLFSLYAIYAAIRDKVPTTEFHLKPALKALGKALPELMIPFLMAGLLIVAGLQIPEAAAMTALYVLIIETLFYRDVKLFELPRVARESLKLVGAIFVLIVAATALTDYFVGAHIPDRLYTWMEANIHSKLMFLLSLNVLLLAVGFVMDIFSAILVVVPLIAPAAARYGVDPYHLGVIFLLNLEIGYVHPPVGLNLFISSFRFGKPMTQLYRAIVPFLLLMLVSLILVTYFPALTPVRAKKAAATGSQGGGGGGTGGPTVDAGLVKIPWKDGGVWTPARCENPEIKGDSLAYADCKSMFTLWTKCEAMQDDPVERLSCEEDVKAGKDPFEADAAPAPGDAGAAAAPGDAGAAPAPAPTK